MRTTFNDDDGNLDEKAAESLELHSGAADLVRGVLVDPDGEYLTAWKIHEQIDRCNDDIDRWEQLEKNAKTSSDALIAEDKLRGLRAEKATLLEQVSSPLQALPQANGQANPVPQQPDAPERKDTEGPRYELLATSALLVTAFGPFTGMKESWFEQLKDKPALLHARKVAGVSGRRSAPPMFCPFEVMCWLISPKRKTGRKISQDKAWDLLERHFPRVFNEHSVADPRKD